MRQRYLTLHRVVGRTYVAGVFISAPLGVYIQYLNEPLGFSRSFTIETGLPGEPLDADDRHRVLVHPAG